MTIKLKLVAALGAGLIFAALTPAHAQWNPTDAYMSNNSYSSGWVNPYNNTMSNIYQSNMNLITQQAIQRSQLFTSTGNGKSYRRNGSARANRVKSLKAQEKAQAAKFEKYKGTMYKESPKSNAAGQLAAVFAKNTKAKQSEIEPVFKALYTIYQQRAKAQGAPSTDVARTLSYVIAANYAVFAGKEGVPEPQIAALRGKMRTALSEDAKFRAMSAAQKQELNETLVILAHFAAWGVEDIADKAPADKRAEVRAGFRKLAGASLQGLLGVKPERVAFDKDGLVIKPA